MSWSHGAMGNVYSCERSSRPEHPCSSFSSLRDTAFHSVILLENTQPRVFRIQVSNKLQLWNYSPNYGRRLAILVQDKVAAHRRKKSQNPSLWMLSNTWSRMLLQRCDWFPESCWFHLYAELLLLVTGPLSFSEDIFIPSICQEVLEPEWCQSQPPIAM